MQAIITTYTSDDNHKAAILAQCQGKWLLRPYDSMLGLDDNHALAAERFAIHMGWRTDWSYGRLPNGDYCHVQNEQSRFFTTRLAPSERSPAETWRGGRAGGSIYRPIA